MIEVNTICKRLKQYSSTRSDVRAFSNALTEQNPETANRLNRDAIIVEKLAFEDAITKVQRSQFYDFSVNELQIVARLKEQNKPLIQVDYTMYSARKALHWSKMTHSYA